MDNSCLNLARKSYTSRHHTGVGQGCQAPGHTGSQIPYQMRPNFTKRGQTSNFFRFPPPGRICKVGQNQRISSTIIRCFPFGSHSRSNKNLRKIMSCAVWRKYSKSGPRRKQHILHCDWLICYDIYVVIGCTSK